ncbi:MAG: energy transducer TonB [Flavobacteriales bacterium]|nr:energy transducer TonB [Flavobacteriales bacterium]
MDLKKNPSADLERHRGSFMLAGLFITLFITYLIINMKFYEVTASELGQLVVEQVEEEIVPITTQNTPPPPAPPPPAAAPEIIQVVDNKVEVAEVEMIDTEADAKTVVEEFTVKEEVVEEEIFTIVESMPEFPGGGQEALFKYLQSEMKYPQIAKENGIQGTVFVNFVVGSNGKIKDVKVLRGVNKLLDDEAIRVVKAMPAWTPGKQRGKAVSVSYNLPIKFTLR